MRRRKRQPIYTCPRCEEIWPKNNEGGYSMFLGVTLFGSKRKEHADLRLCLKILSKKYQQQKGEILRLVDENEWFRQLFVEPKANR